MSLKLLPPRDKKVDMLHELFINSQTVLMFSRVFIFC